MSAASTIIGRCNSCCDARLRTEILTGKRLGEKSVEGFLGFDDGSLVLAGGVTITDDWSMWGRVFDRVETSGSATNLSAACSDCGSTNPLEQMSERSLESFGALSTADFSVRESRCSGGEGCGCTLTFPPVEHGAHLPYTQEGSTPWAVSDTVTGESLVAMWNVCVNTASRQIGSLEAVLVDEIIPEQDVGEAPVATGLYACSQTEVAYMGYGGGSFKSRWPRNSFEDDSELTTGSATYGARQIARRRYTLTGTPLQTYDVTIILEETRLSSPMTYADVEVDYTVTTDADGVAEWEDDIPLPPGDRRRCLKDYTIV
jgi:hypothetical protein